MMANRIISVVNYKFSSEDKLFLDTNIWIYLFGPQKPKGGMAAMYSQAFKKILSAKCHIYIDMLVISEFINAYARLVFNILDKKDCKFKEFRNSMDFKPIAQDIAGDVKCILKQCKWIENSFDTLNIHALITEYAKGNSDFNDQVIAELCKKRSLKLITHDGDFKNPEILIMTANQRLLE